MRSASLELGREVVRSGLAGVAPAEAFEEQGMVADPDGETRASIGMGRAQAHGAARLPDAAEAFDDIRADGLQFGVLVGGEASHR
ncbi:hypothetical protein [Sphingobium sp. BS19]|uniref:hypothetical protein n=1 Tax=Sphingobium sp. BS19 TaxID=3018973 RepID=UPI0035D0BD45